MDALLAEFTHSYGLCSKCKVLDWTVTVFSVYCEKYIDKSRDQQGRGFYGDGIECVDEEEVCQSRTEPESDGRDQRDELQPEYICPEPKDQ